MLVKVVLYGTLTPKLGARLGKTMAAEMSWAWIAQCSSSFMDRAKVGSLNALEKHGIRNQSGNRSMRITIRQFPPH
jgi:hypothetical protein